MKTFEIVEKIPKATIIHHIDGDGKVWATRGRRVFYRNNQKWYLFAVFPFSSPRDFFAFSRPTARAMRSDKCNLYVNKSGNILGIRGGWAFSVERGRVNLLFRIQGDCVLHGSICEDAKGNFYFGEYFMNPERKNVRIWRVASNLSSWQAAYELENTRHVHGIYRDSFDENNFWVTVGDFQGECFILRTNDNFKTFTKFGDGSQTWRAVNLFFTEDHVTWLTDSNLETNHACRMHRVTGKLETGQPIDASSWYGCTTSDGVNLAFTTIERGPAIKSDRSSILISDDAFNWQRIYTFKKDFWKPVQVFKYGVISCPSGQIHSDSIYLSGEGLVGFDGVSIKARLI